MPDRSPSAHPAIRDRVPCRILDLSRHPCRRVAATRDQGPCRQESGSRRARRPERWSAYKESARQPPDREASSPSEGWCAMTLIHRKLATPRATARSKGGGGRASRRRFRLPDRRRFVAGASALLIPTAFVVQAAGISPANALVSPPPGPVGNGFVVTAGDLSFILKQIKIAERHSATLTASNPCGTLVNDPTDNIPDADQIPDALTSYGLRTVDGSCNNLVPSTDVLPHRDKFGAADQVFPRLTSPVFSKAEGRPADFFGP